MSARYSAESALGRRLVSRCHTAARRAHPTFPAQEAPCTDGKKTTHPPLPRRYGCPPAHPCGCRRQQSHAQITHNREKHVEGAKEEHFRVRPPQKKRRQQCSSIKFFEGTRRMSRDSNPPNSLPISLRSPAFSHRRPAYRLLNAHHVASQNETASADNRHERSREKREPPTRRPTECSTNAPPLPAYPRAPFETVVYVVFENTVSISHRVERERGLAGPFLGPRLLLLVLVEGEQRDAGDLDHLEADTGDVTHGVTAATEPRDEHLVLREKKQRKK